MRKEGLLLTMVCGLVATGAPALFAQTASDGAARFTENAMKLRESILFKKEPSSLQKTTLGQPDDKYPWHIQIVTTVFWIGESPPPTTRFQSFGAWDINWREVLADLRPSQAGGLSARIVPGQNPFYPGLP
jgi:hypothetical protein